jgi:Domain of unknown function (DUF4340)
MSEKTLKRLVGALAIVVVLWAAVTLLGRRGGSSAPTGDIVAFFAGVDSASVKDVKIVKPTGDTIELQPQDDSWKVNGFRADSGSVSRFFQALKDTKVDALAATNPANHARMGVSQDSASTLTLDVGGSQRSLLLGKTGERTATIYARLPGKDDVYLLDSPLRTHVTRGLDDWRNRRMLAIDTSKVTRLAVQRDKDSYTLVRKDSTWTFQNGNPTDSIKVQNILGQLGGGLVASRFVPDDDPLAANPPGGSTTAYAANGDVLAKVTIGSGDGDRWAMAQGDSVRYRLASFRIELITPKLDDVKPSGSGGAK